MTFEQRLSAIERFGFNAREARFLVTVLLHSGVCVARQFCNFCGIARGQVSHNFFSRLVERAHASRYTDAHHGMHVYHLHHRALHAAIGQPDSRFRKPTPLPAAIERLMLLDAVLSRPDTAWLATESDKVAHFTKLLGVEFRREDLPHLTFGRQGQSTVRLFPDRLPIGVDPEGRTHVFAYLVTRASPVEFRAFLHRHAELFRALPGWRIWLLLPLPLEKAGGAFHVVVQEELATPLRPVLAEELLWYFTNQGLLSAGHPEWDRYQRARRAFGAPRFRSLYRTWLKTGRSCVDATVSRTLSDALERGLGQVESHVLTHPYLRLASVVGTA